MELPRGKLPRVAAFLVTVLLVVAGTAVGPYVATLGGQQPTAANYSEYAVSSVVPERAEATGHPSVDRRDDRGLVVIDRTHLNRFTRDEIQPLVDAVTEAGYRVEFLSGTDSMDVALSRADAFVVVDPGTAYTGDEADRVESFVDRGGRLVLMGEPTYLAITGGFASTARNQLSSLSTEFGIEFGSDYLYNMERRDGHFQNVFANAAGDGPVVDGVDRAAFYTATQVTSPAGTPLLVATDRTRNSRNDATGDYTLALRQGNVLAVGDTTFLERANSNVVDNEQFIGNVAEFLVTGERERTLLEYPAVVDRDPTVSYTSPELLEAGQGLGADLRAPGRQPTVTLATGDVSDEVDVLVTTYEYLRTHTVGDTGITLSGGEVSVPGYESDTEGIVVVRAPAEGRYDLVVAADTAERADRGVDILTSDEVEQYTVGDRTAVVRTAAASAPDFNQTG